MREETKPHIVIIGGGFAGLEVAKRLRKSKVRITLLDRHNYHLFQPLLYQVATGGLSPANIATPLRSILRKQKNVAVQMAEVTGFDITNKRVLLADGEVDFDTLVLAAGSTHSYFGRDEWQTHAPGLKTLGDATEIRRRVYLAFEAAEREINPAKREALLTFVVVGGGPTGVELAGALAEIARYTLKHDFRNIQSSQARILLVEAAPDVLGAFPEELRQRGAKKIADIGIEIRTDTKVTEITPEFVRLNDEVVATRTVLWGAGVKANSLAQNLAQACGQEPDRSGRIPVTERLQIPDQEGVYALGDLAHLEDTNGNPLPGLASVAVQQGRYLAKSIKAQAKGKKPLPPFTYKDKGTMATIGRSRAVAKIGKRTFCGFFAWILWLFVHLMLIVQFQNRVLILLQWAWSYVTFNRSNRIISGEEALIMNPPAPSSQSTEPDCS